MNNPFVSRVEFGSLAELREQRVDRDHEIATCTSALVEHKHNVMLYGERGVGKTFLVRLIEQDVSERQDLYSCYVNLANLGAYAATNGSDVAAFPRAVLLQLCASLWTRLLGEPYSDLRGSLRESGVEIKIRGKDYKTVQRIYTQLMTMLEAAKFDFLNSVGFSAGLKGDKKEETHREVKFLDVLPFEFGEFASELIEDVLKRHKKQRVLVLCDEANIMPLFKQEQILERYLELFRSRRIQFLFVCAPLPWEQHSEVPLCFETRLELKGFRSIDDVKQLICQQACGVQFTSEAFDVLYELFEGHPRHTLEVCRQAFSLATQAGKDTITAADMLRCATDHKERMREYEASLKAMREC